MILLLLSSAMARDWEDCAAWGKQPWGRVIQMDAEGGGDTSRLARLTRSYADGELTRMESQWVTPNQRLCFDDVLSTWYGLKLELQWAELGANGYAMVDGGSMLQLGDPSKIFIGAASFFLPTLPPGDAPKAHLVFGRAGEEKVAGSRSTSFRVEVTDPSSGVGEIAVADLDDVEKPSGLATHEVIVGHGPGALTIRGGQARRVLPGAGGAVPVDRPGSAEAEQARMLAQLVEDRGRLSAHREVEGASEAEGRVLHLVLPGHDAPVQVRVDGEVLPRWSWNKTIDAELGFAVRSVEELRLTPGAHQVEVWSARGATEPDFRVDPRDVAVADQTGDLQVARGSGAAHSVDFLLGVRAGYSRNIIQYGVGGEADAMGQTNGVPLLLAGGLRWRLGAVPIVTEGEWRYLPVTNEGQFGYQAGALRVGTGGWSGANWLAATIGASFGALPTPEETGNGGVALNERGTVPQFTRSLALRPTLALRWDRAGRATVGGAPTPRIFPFLEACGELGGDMGTVRSLGGAVLGIGRLQVELGLGGSYTASTTAATEGDRSLRWGSIDMLGGVRWSSF